MDKKATRLFITRSSPSQPQQSFLADENGQRIAWIEENRLDAKHPYAPYLASHVLPRFGTIKGPSGDTLYYRMITPPNMVAGKHYPVFFEHYGGPHVQTVSRNWGGALHQYIASKGYIVFMIDNRGSANRGVKPKPPVTTRRASAACLAVGGWRLTPLGWPVVPEV